MGKIKIFNINKKIAKTKEEVDIKNNVRKLIENLKSDKIDIELSSKFSILKDLLNDRKDKTIGKVMNIDYEVITKTKKDVTIPLATNSSSSLDISSVNALDNQPRTSTREMSHLGPSTS
ncbi:hypothetical protein [Spiroplasma endosymbiont of Melieria omissa]|uniref:hypothetical protein n=1 Tax=Spiroplasma endosymbiont of Melieria omissa TaxID=3139324 RepID=UPI003CCB0299